MGLTPYVECLKLQPLRNVTIKMLSNLCNDYEPAQKAAAGLNLHIELFYLLHRCNSMNSSDSVVQQPALYSTTVDLLLQIVEHRTPTVVRGGVVNKESTLEAVGQVLEAKEDFQDPENGPQSLSDEWVAVMLGLPCDIEVEDDDFVILFGICLDYLREDVVRTYLVESQAVELVWNLVVVCDKRGSSVAYKIEGEREHVECKELAEKMSAASEGILNCLSDLASTPGFRGEYNIGHPFLSDLVHVLLSVELIAPGRWHLLQPTGACLVLGNLARTDEICIRMVEELQIHKPLVHILGNTSDARLSHAAAGFLKQLARPKENEETLRAAGTVKAVFRQLSSDKFPDLTHALLSLLRHLLIDSPENVKQVLVPADYPRPNEGLLSNVHMLLSIFTRSDNAAIKTEIGLIFKEICKCLVSLQREMAIEHGVFGQLCLHADVTRPADFLIRQTQPLLQSQGWFTFALLARSRAGSRAVASCIANDGLYDLLAQRTGAYHEQELAVQVQMESGVSDKISDAVGQVNGNSVEHNDVERSNALMLVHELLRNGIPDSQLRARLQGLLDTTGASS